MATATELAVIAAAQKAAGELHASNPALDLVELYEAAEQANIGTDEWHCLFMVAFVAEYINRNQQAVTVPYAGEWRPATMVIPPGLEELSAAHAAADEYCQRCGDSFAPTISPEYCDDCARELEAMAEDYLVNARIGQGG